MSQKELRNKIKQLHDCISMPYSLVAKECQLSGTYICLWVKGEKTMSDEKIKKVEEFYSKIVKEVGKII